MRATVWAIATINANGQTVETIKSSPRESRARKHVERLNRERKDNSVRYVLQGDKIKR